MQKTEIKNSFILLSFLNQDSINFINDFLKRSGAGTQYTKKIVGKNTRVIRTRKKFKFWDKLIREKPGFDRFDDEI
ncbi:hypothetical protein ES708_30646 [subsurface metagenome]